MHNGIKNNIIYEGDIWYMYYFQTAIKEKSKSKEVKKDHWLDYAADKHGNDLVEDIKSTLKVLVLYIPLPVFWALFDQQGTGWTFQARRMDGYIGFYTILPDQMQVVNPLLILLFIPLFQYIIYPALDKCKVLTTPLQRLTAGGVLASVSFVVSAIIYLALESNYPVEPSTGNAQLRIYNSLSCNASIRADGLVSERTISIPSGGYYENIDIEVKNVSRSIVYTVSAPWIGSSSTRTLELEEETSVGLFLNVNEAITFKDDVSKESNGYPRFRFVKLTDFVQDSFLNAHFVLVPFLR